MCKSLPVFRVRGLELVLGPLNPIPNGPVCCTGWVVAILIALAATVGADMGPAPTEDEGEAAATATAAAATVDNSAQTFVPLPSVPVLEAW